MGDWPAEHEYFGFSHCVRCARKVKEELDKDLSAATQRAADAERERDEAVSLLEWIEPTLRLVWSFDNDQRHTHTWHSREDFIVELNARLSRLAQPKETKP